MANIGLPDTYDSWRTASPPESDSELPECDTCHEAPGDRILFGFNDLKLCAACFCEAIQINYTAEELAVKLGYDYERYD